MTEDLAIGALVAVLTVAALAVAYRAIRRWQAQQEEGRAAEARARAGLPPAARDNEPGTNLADLDECQLILSLPLYGTGDHTTTHHEGDQL